MDGISIPYNWKPRPYQAKLWLYLQGGGKRAVEVAHRRWGKDEVCLHWSAVSAMSHVATYWHMLPEASQARKAIWDAVNPHSGKRRIDEAFPKQIRATTREDQMMIRFINGSTWQVVGSDNYDSLVGSPPHGIVFSEWPLSKQDAWVYLRPILAENGGWAVFIYTPRGDNHGKRTYDFSITEPSWFSELSAADETTVFTKEQLDAERRELIAQYGSSRGEALYKQEYFCSFVQAFTGKAVYPEFSYKHHVADSPLLPIVVENIRTGSNKTIVRGWDHTGLHPGCVITYLHGNEWMIVKEFWEDDLGIEDFADAVKMWCGQNLPAYTEYRDIGDPAGNKTRDSRKKTPADYIREHCGILILDGIQTFKIRRESVAKRLTRRGGLVIDPTECPLLIEGFLGGYGYPEIGKTGQFKDRPFKDKYADCFVAGTKISTPSGGKNIEDLRCGDFVITPFGNRRVVDAWLQKENASVIELEFSNGRTIVCTPDHKFYVREIGLVSADELQYDMILESVNIERRLLWRLKRWLSLRGENTGFLEAITNQTGGIKTGLLRCMLLFGKTIIKDLFLMDGVYTTSTITSQTTTYPTLKLWKGLPTHRTMPKKVFWKPLINFFAGSGLLKRRQKNGTDLKMAANGTEGTANPFGKTRSTEQRFAIGAARSTVRGATGKQDIVQARAKEWRETNAVLMTLSGYVKFAALFSWLTNIEPNRRAPRLVRRSWLTQPRDVYSLWVEKDHVYYANGVLVKNCHDALQYPATRLFGPSNRGYKPKPEPEMSWASL